MQAAAAPVLPATAIVLDYDQTLGVRTRTPPWLRELALLVSLPAAVAPFIDFTYHTSPASVVSEFAKAMFRDKPDEGFVLILIAMPFCLGIVIALRRLRLLNRHRKNSGQHDETDPQQDHGEHHFGECEAATEDTADTAVAQITPEVVFFESHLIHLGSTSRCSD